MKSPLVYILSTFPVSCLLAQNDSSDVADLPVYLWLILLFLVAIVSILLTRMYHLRKQKEILVCKENHACEEIKEQIAQKREESLETYMQVVCKKNQFLKDVRDGLETMRNKDAKQWVNKISAEVSSTDEVYYSLFSAVYPHFLRKLKKEHPKLTEKDVKMLTLLYVGLDCDEMSCALDISSASVNANRYRLKSKMGIDKETKLKEYLKKYD